ncbi:MAG: ATP-dependent helicase [Lentisphaeria bacterium]|jgi:DNA helicase-2/ATP-dependent DNA helicase PcrA
MHLNPQQQAVISHGETPLLVIAGAGTGKTTVMTHRAAALVARGLDPRRLLLLTFTRKAAEELRTRAAARLALPPADLPWCGTFHAIAARLLRRFGRTLGVPPAFSILDETDARDLLDHVASELCPNRGKDNFPSKGLLRRLHSFQANTQRPLAEVVEELAPRFASQLPLLEQLFAAYNQRKRAAQALDYDDLLLRWLDLLRNPTPDADCARLFDAVMVDEYQDTNAVQSQILRELCRHQRNITVVGDDAQAIYAFRGATVENILGFERQFPTVIRLQLEENYRSTQEILDAANALWEEAETGFKKELTAAAGPGRQPRLERCQDELAQASQAIGEILESWQRDRVPLREMAVLFRASHHSFLLESLLKKYRIPFRKFGGQRFMDAAHVKDTLAFLRVLENPKDEPAWRRLLCLLPGIGSATAGKHAATLLAGAAPADFFATCKLPAKAQPYRAGLAALFHALANPELALSQQIGHVLEFYEPLLPLHYDFPDSREKDLEELPQMASQFAGRREFLDEVLTGDDSVVQNPALEADEYLTLSTIHSAKGLEWRRVYLLQLVEGALPAGPSQEDAAKVEEERRLLYVAMTRAKEELVLFQPLSRRTRDGQAERCLPSRFLTSRVLATLRGGLPPGGKRPPPITHHHHPPPPPPDDGELRYEPADDDDATFRPPAAATTTTTRRRGGGRGHSLR